MSFPSTTEPNIWLNEEAAEHGNVILVQARQLERNNTKREVAFGNETSISFEGVKKQPQCFTVGCVLYSLSPTSR